MGAGRLALDMGGRGRPGGTRPQETCAPGAARYAFFGTRYRRCRCRLDGDHAPRPISVVIVHARFGREARRASTCAAPPPARCPLFPCAIPISMSTVKSRQAAPLSPPLYPPRRLSLLLHPRRSRFVIFLRLPPSAPPVPLPPASGACLVRAFVVVVVVAALAGPRVRLDAVMRAAALLLLEQALAARQLPRVGVRVKVSRGRGGGIAVVVIVIRGEAARGGVIAIGAALDLELAGSLFGLFAVGARAGGSGWRGSVGLALRRCRPGGRLAAGRAATVVARGMTVARAVAVPVASGAVLVLVATRPMAVVVIVAVVIFAVGRRARAVSASPTAFAAALPIAAMAG